MSKYINSRYLAIAISIIVVVIHYYTRQVNYNNWSNMLGWDVLAYYLYLPFTFIYGDPGMSDQTIVQYIFDNYNPSGSFYQAFALPNGNWSPMYNLGMAIFYLPFFLIAHAWALLSAYPADGFSFPYQYTIANGVMIYIVIGIFMIRKVLLNFFTDRVTSLVMIFMLLGTTFFHESIADELGPHAISFAAFAVVLHYTIKWHTNPTGKTAFVLGLALGLTILARGSGIVIALIPLLWDVYDKESFLAKVKMVWKNIGQIGVGLIGLFLFPLVQIIYWKYVTGSFIFDTYQVTPGFDWLEPHFAKVFFSYKKGWFLYTPMILFAIAGLFFLRKYNKHIAWGIISFFILNVYMISSWGTWWQGGSFGSRYFVESYAILAIPFGYFIVELENRKILYRIFLVLASFFLFLNLFQTWQFNNWIFDGYSMTKTYYWKVFLKTSVSEEDRKYREIIRDFKSEEAFTNPEDYNKRTYAFLDFDENLPIEVHPDFLDTSYFVSPPHACKITADRIYGPTFKIRWRDMTDREHVWIRVKFKYLVEHDLKASPASLVIELNHNEGQYIEKYRNWELEEQDFVPGEWNDMEVDYLTPYPLSVNKDKIKIYVYVRGQEPIWVDDMKVEVFERKW